jgi:hypothetical protein
MAVPTLAVAALRGAHKRVLPPVPLSFSLPVDPIVTIASSPALVSTPASTFANISGLCEQQRWHSTLDCMEREPHADLLTIQRIRSWITHGVTLDIASPPSNIDHDNTFSVTQHADEVRTRIREYIDFGAITLLSDDYPRPFGIQPLHVIIKPGRKPRLVIDLSRNLNDNLEYEYFSYSSVRDATEISTPGCWYSKLNLSNCFLSFPLHPSATPHFIFRFEGQVYQFIRMPFGLSSAPRICTELLSVVAFGLSQKGIDRLVRYLDDFLFVHDTSTASQAALLTAQRVISEYGLVVNPDKTEGPAQRITFLGILLDSIERTLSCTPERLAELRSLLSQSVAGAEVKITFLDTLIGKLQFVSQVLPGARPFTHRIMALRKERCARLERRPVSQSDRRRVHFARRGYAVRIDRHFRADVRFWQSHLHRWNGTQRWRSARSAPFVFASDASLSGFGFYIESIPPSAVVPSHCPTPLQVAPSHWPTPLQVVPSHCPTPLQVAPSHWPTPLQVGSGFSGIYSSTDASLHAQSSQMTWCEMFAVYAALCTYRSVLCNCCVLFLMDNETDVHILNRQATRSQRLAGLLREIYTIAVDRNISIYAKHRAGVDNVLADFLSRPDIHHHTDIVGTWAHLYPDRAHQLSHVSVVYSHQFGTKRARPSLTSSVASP